MPSRAILDMGGPQCKWVPRFNIRCDQSFGFVRVFKLAVGSMGNPGNSRDEIRARIKPILDNVAVDGLRAWLRSIDLPSAAYSRAAITDLVSKQIAGKGGDLSLAVLDAAANGSL